MMVELEVIVDDIETRLMTWVGPLGLGHTYVCHICIFQLHAKSLCAIFILEIDKKICPQLNLKLIIQLFFKISSHYPKIPDPNFEFY